MQQKQAYRSVGLKLRVLLDPLDLLNVAILSIFHQEYFEVVHLNWLNWFLFLVLVGEVYSLFY